MHYYSSSLSNQQPHDYQAIIMSTAVVRKLINIEITSDSICPFCIVGYRRILSAIKQTSHLPIDYSISFSPFMLDPTLPMSPGDNKRQRYNRRYGTEMVENMEREMIARGKAEGINFSYGGNISNTNDSHRLIEKAREIGGEKGQLAIVEKFFSSCKSSSSYININEKRKLIKFY